MTLVTPWFVPSIAVAGLGLALGIYFGRTRGDWDLFSPMVGAVITLLGIAAALALALVLKP